MKVSEQILIRREKLGLSRREFADRVGVTEQATRHWEDGRSFPGKAKAKLVEAALSFTIDWTEGLSPQGSSNSAAAMVDKSDMDLLLVICRLPAKAKELIGDFARMHAELVDEVRKQSHSRDEPPPSPPPPAVRKSPARHR